MLSLSMSHVMELKRHCQEKRKTGYTHLLKLDVDLGFSITHFIEVQKLRNQAIHAGLAIGNIEKGAEVEKHELNCLNQIIKHFGI